VEGSIIRDYEYDLLGNFDSVTKGSTLWDYSYAADNPSRLMSVTNLAMTVNATQGYDSRGNLWKYTKSGIAYELAFDVENRLQSVKVGTGTPTTFEYDDDGQRVLTTIGTGTSQVKIYTPFPDYEKEIPTSGSTTIRTTYRIAGQIVAVQTKVGPAAGTFYFTYTDHLGNVAALSWTGGTLVPGSLASYDPFGTLTTTPSTNPSITNHGFTGHRHNNTGSNDLGLIYMNARYYLPQIGRFVSPDSIVPEPSNPQSLNRYSYSYNNPINYTDPTGHKATSGCEYEKCGSGSSSDNYLFQQSDGQLVPWNPEQTEPRYDAVTFGGSADIGSGVLGFFGFKGSVGFQVLYNTQSHELTSFLNYSGSAANAGAIGNLSFYVGGVSDLGESNYAYSGAARSVSATGSAGLLGLTTGISAEQLDNLLDPQGTFTEYIGWAPGMGVSVAASDSYSVPILTNNLETGESSWDIVTFINEEFQAQLEQYSNAWATLTSWFDN